jgi:uncharacterized protein (TIGR00369 family)
MRKIRNPFRGLEGYNCFGCSPENSHGLHMDFVEAGDEIVSRWNPNGHFQGFRNVLHGGIQATLMDEIASWTVYVKLKRSGVTSKMDVRYLKPVYISAGLLTIHARIKEVRRNIADIEVRIFNSDEVLCSEAVVSYFTFSPEKSKETFFYPDPEDFFEKEK